MPSADAIAVLDNSHATGLLTRGLTLSSEHVVKLCLFCAHFWHAE